MKKIITLVLLVSAFAFTSCTSENQEFSDEQNEVSTTNNALTGTYRFRGGYKVRFYNNGRCYVYNNRTPNRTYWITGSGRSKLIYIRSLGHYPLRKLKVWKPWSWR